MRLNNEHQLLVHCIEPDPSRDRLEKLLHRPINWNEVEKLAIWHRLPPLLYQNLKSSRADSGPEPSSLMGRLESVYMGTLVRNLYLRSELVRIADAFQSGSVPLIVLKGLALAETIYEDVALRPIADIDLLVRVSDLDRARLLLRELGYESPFKGSLESPGDGESADEAYHQTLHHPEKGIPVELHWHITREGHPKRISLTDTAFIEGLWERAQPEHLGDADVLVLSPPDTIDHLCVHFMKHRFGAGGAAGFTSQFALIQLSDILRCLRRFGDVLDFEDLLAGEGWEAAGRTVAVTLQVLRGLMKGIGGELEIPDGSGSGWLPAVTGADAKLAQLIQSRMFVQEVALPIVPLGKLDFIRSTLRAVFPPRPQMAKQYGVAANSGRLYVYYLLRPFLLLRHRKQFLRELRRIREDVLLNRWVRAKD